MSEMGVSVPEEYRTIAELVAGYVDDKLGELRQEVSDTLGEVINSMASHRRVIEHMQGTVGGLRDAVADLQANAGESMPEHVYKQFIRAEAERLRIVKRAVTPSSTSDPNTSQ